VSRQTPEPNKPTVQPEAKTETGGPPPSGSHGSSRLVRRAMLIAALGGLLFGYDTGVISGAILFITQQFNLSSGMQELVVSAVLIGAVIGALVGGPLADRAGRRKVIIWAGIIFIVAAIYTAFAITIWGIIAGRIIVGIAIGIASFSSPLYISEVAGAYDRGGSVSINQLVLTIGIVVAYLVDFAFTPISGWRFMFGLAAIPAIALVIGMLRVPESPRWLLSKGKIDQAAAIIKRFENKTDVSADIQNIQLSLKEQKGGVKDLLQPMLRVALFVGIGLAIFQQITGINTVIYYAPTIFGFAGFQSSSAQILATVGVGIVNVGFTFLAIKLIDRLGRRPLLLWGVFGQILGLFLLGVCFLYTDSSIIGIISIVSMAIYIASFAIGLGPVFWLLISEIYPLKVRGVAMSIASVANWLFNLIVAITFLSLINMIGQSGTFFMYGGIAVISWLFIYRRVPETRGQTLEQIEEYWRSGKHLRRLRDRFKKNQA
jgi:SP family galactose:H+ symporter-like MFS transporter